MRGIVNLKIWLAMLVFLFGTGRQAGAGSVNGWGSIFLDSDKLAANDFVAIAAGEYHSLALRSDGSIVGWGSNYDDWGNWVGQATPPTGNNYIAISPTSAVG
jgi:alpha-tubulin suppressor-like RCC1 family protein